MAYNSSYHRSGYPSVTATARVADNLALYGHRPSADEPEYRPMPEPEQLTGAVSCLFSAITGPFTDTALEPDIDDMLWSLANTLHHKTERMQRLLDDNEAQQRASLEEQDGSEVRSVELERLTDKGRALMDRRNAFEHMRDAAAEAYENETGSVWRPRSGSVVNRKAQTAAMVDSRDYLNAKRYAETNVMMPAGTKIAIAGGLQFQDHTAIYAALDAALVRFPDMVLLHGAAKTGVDHLALTWARNKGVKAIGFEPEWNRHNRAAPFKRNDKMLEATPAEVIVFPGNGITDNLADKAKEQRIRVVDCRNYSERPVMPNGTPKSAQS
jgi:hypothetical protein